MISQSYHGDLLPPTVTLLLTFLYSRWKRRQNTSRTICSLKVIQQYRSHERAQTSREGYLVS
jgi:hypothetical protein